MEKGVIIKDIATNSSTLKELEDYFGVGVTEDAAISVIDKIDEEENH
jgi:ABC-2 type transport system ATP-binding protein